MIGLGRRYHAFVDSQNDLYVMGELNSVKYADWTNMGVSNVVALSCGYNHLMIVTPDGLWAIGANAQGQLGLNDKNDRNQFVAVPFEGTIVSVSCLKESSMLHTTTGIYATHDDASGFTKLPFTELISPPTPHLVSRYKEKDVVIERDEEDEQGRNKRKKLTSCLHCASSKKTMYRDAKIGAIFCGKDCQALFHGAFRITGQQH
jgi:hypothetical protein